MEFRPTTASAWTFREVPGSHAPRLKGMGTPDSETQLFVSATIAEPPACWCVPSESFVGCAVIRKGDSPSRPGRPGNRPGCVQEVLAGVYGRWTLLAASPRWSTRKLVTPQERSLQLLPLPITSHVGGRLFGELDCAPAVRRPVARDHVLLFRACPFRCALLSVRKITTLAVMGLTDRSARCLQQPFRWKVVLDQHTVSAR